MVSTIVVVERLKKRFNNFQTPFDRKNLIGIFDFLKPEFGYKVDAFNGQVVLRRSVGVSVLYNSKREEELADPQRFEQFILQELQPIIEGG